jgi:hypothetical protein
MQLAGDTSATRLAHAFPGSLRVTGAEQQVLLLLLLLALNVFVLVVAAIFTVHYSQLHQIPHHIFTTITIITTTAITITTIIVIITNTIITVAALPRCFERPMCWAPPPALPMLVSSSMPETRVITPAKLSSTPLIGGVCCVMFDV